MPCFVIQKDGKPIQVVLNLADAQEYVLSIAEEKVYDAFLLNNIRGMPFELYLQLNPVTWYKTLLKLYSSNLTIQETFLQGG